jgi:hypothetical protein
LDSLAFSFSKYSFSALLVNAIFFCSAAASSSRELVLKLDGGFPELVLQSLHRSTKSDVRQTQPCCDKKKKIFVNE